MAGASSDLEINSAVRRVLVRHWIDLGRISIRTQKGTVTVRGVLDKLPESDQPLTPQVVEGIFSDIRRIHGARRAIAQLDNWEQSSFGWRIREGMVTPGDGSITGQGSGTAPKINIDEWIKKANEELRSKGEKGQDEP